MCPERGREGDLGVRYYPLDSLMSLGLEQEGQKSLRYDVICPRDAREHQIVALGGLSRSRASNPAQPRHLYIDPDIDELLVYHRTVATSCR